MGSGALEAWTVSEFDYPREGTQRQQIHHCLRYALLAPSSHNVQPWLFRAEDDEIELLADRSRALPVVDPFDRELVISCGAALFNLRTALSRYGWRCEVHALPDATNQDLLARILLTGRAAPGEEMRMLFQAIPRRHTNRGTFEDRPVPRDLLREFEQLAHAEGAWFSVLEGEQRETAANLIARGDEAQFGDPHFRRELAAWTFSNHSHTRQGLPGYALGESEVASVVAPLLVRTLDLSKLGLARRDRELAVGSPVLAVLGTQYEEQAAWLAAGQALQHVLLRAASCDLQCSYLNQPIEVQSLRPNLARLTGRPGSPQLLLRMGYAGAARPTPRRSLDDVLVGA